MTTRRWGMTEAEWAESRGELNRLLAEVAATRSTVTYGEVARRVFGGRFSARSGALMDLLGEVDTQQMDERGVMVASLVVRADTGRPGDGYFHFAEQELGLDVTDREAFWRGEAEAVWESYRSGDGGSDRS